MFRGGVLATLALLGSACANEFSSTAPATNNGTPGIVAGTLDVSTANGAVMLRNTTEHLIGYMVIDNNRLMSVAPCGSTCPIVVQGATSTVPFAQITGYSLESSEAQVLWWKYTVRTDGAKVADGSMQTTTIKLK